jgi:MinD-like ATPase involved in chromosome partitioning or flagellar assembly
MRILVYSFKGGTGKSTIALNWALTLDWGVITNDLYSPIDRVLEKKRVYKLQVGQPLPDLPEGVDVVYDFGGYVDDRVVKAMEDADAIIVPTTNAFAEIQVALETIKEAERHNKRIVVVANKAGKGDLEYVQSAIGKFFKYPVLPLKATKALTRIYSSKKSLRAAADSLNPLDRLAYTAAADQFDAIVAAITKRK